MTTNYASTGAFNDWLKKKRPGDWKNLQAAYLLAQNQNIPKPPTLTTWADMADVIGPIKWHWDGWLPAGLLTMIVSASGAGKSALVLQIANSFLTGANWPDNTPFTGETGKVLWAEAEAAQAINLDRARKWNLPLDMLATPFDDPLTDFNLLDDDHKKRLAAQAALPEVRIIIVDSLSGAANDDDRKEVKDAVKWLADLAKKTNKSVLLTHHLRKKGILDGDNITLDRIRGSSKVVQFARVVWALSRPDQTIETKRLQVIKSNIGRFPEAVGMNINGGGVLFGNAPECQIILTPLMQAKELLMLLLQNGRVKAKQIDIEFEGAGISDATKNRAKKELNVVSAKDGNVWYWSLPPKNPLL